MDKPFTYKRTLTKRESFRVDLDKDEMRVALSFAIDEVIPESAAFRVHDDGGVTFCWDIDRDADWNESERCHIPFVKHTAKCCLSYGHAGLCKPVKNIKLVEPAPDEEGDPAPDDDGRTVTYVTLLDERVQPADESSPAPDQDGRLGGLVPADVILFDPLDPLDNDSSPAPQVAQVEAASVDDKPAVGEPDSRGVVLERSAPSKDPATGFAAAVGDGDQGGLGHFRDERSSDQEQCKGVFREGVTRQFRCHLDLGHDNPCGPAEGREPEDPPKGRRRSW